MEIQRLTDSNTIKNIYDKHMLEDFPPNELTPFFVIQKYMEEGKFEGYGLYEDAALLGYAFFIRIQAKGRFHYLFDYFAITPEYRNQGLGSLFLKEHLPCIKDAAFIVGEVEDPDKAEDEESRSIRESRMQFYLRNGFVKTDVTATVYGADYRILECPVTALSAAESNSSAELNASAPLSAGSTPHSANEIEAVYTSIYEQIAPDWFLKEHFKTYIS